LPKSFRAWTIFITFKTGGAQLPKYVIEREIPGAGNLKPEELQAISQKSCGVLKNLGPQVQWLHSYVT
jgi:trimethylamine:corrinoid methyltransferase-like protein